MLIRYWLRQEPSDDWEAFHQQFRQAEWMESRFYGELTTLLSNKITKAMG
ncbi:hypothetical protein [Deinococcus cellulosilyticus]|nr:hypothetical protein [Deinococcus cellulosilyticus]